MTLHGEIDTVSVFGDILFSDGENTIIENDTFVDSWLAAFIENIDKIKKHDQIEIDVYSGPKKLDSKDSLLTIKKRGSI